jgi:CheY-like chemotaxis protein
MDKNKIALVDDEKGTRVLHAGLIRSIAPDAEFLEAADGIEGLKVVQEHRPGLVLTDYDMPPQIDGYELIRRIRALDPAYQPIIMLITSMSKVTIQGTQVSFSRGNNEVGGVRFYYHPKDSDFKAFLDAVKKNLPQ